VDLNINDISQIEGYLLNKLTGDELKVFESKMANDAAFKKQVVEYGELVLGIKQVAAVDLKNTIAESIGNVKVEPNAYKPSNSTEPAGSSIAKKLITFLVIAGAIAAIIYYYLNNKTELKQKWDNSIQKIESEITKTTTDTIFTIDGKEVTDPALKKRLQENNFGSDTVFRSRTIKPIQEGVAQPE